YLRRSLGGVAFCSFAHVWNGAPLHWPNAELSPRQRKRFLIARLGVRLPPSAPDAWNTEQRSRNGSESTGVPWSWFVVPAKMAGWQSGQLQRAVNSPPSGYGGSNPPPATKRMRGQDEMESGLRPRSSVGRARSW